MAKMGNGSGVRDIPLSQIVETGNVRITYDKKEIEELAASFKEVGQLTPINVKPYEPDENGNERFEIIAGHRRRRAAQLLHDAGESWTTIKGIITTGDKLTLQLVENLQRSDLTAIEREKGIYEMCQNGLAQKEVAARLSKPIDYISRNVSAYKIREAASAEKIDTSKLATATLNAVQAAAPADYPALVKEIINNGGTLEAARVVMENYNVSKGKPANPRKAKEKENGGLSDPLQLHPSPVSDKITEELSENGVDTEIDIALDGAENESGEKLDADLWKKHTGGDSGLKKPEKKNAKSARSWLDDFVPPEHKQVDFNTVCLAIMRYAKEREDDESVQETIKDIIALLHEELK